MPQIAPIMNAQFLGSNRGPTRTLRLDSIKLKDEPDYHYGSSIC